MKINFHDLYCHLHTFHKNIHTVPCTYLIDSRLIYYWLCYELLSSSCFIITALRNWVQIAFASNDLHESGLHTVPLRAEELGSSFSSPGAPPESHWLLVRDSCLGVSLPVQKGGVPALHLGPACFSVQVDSYFCVQDFCVELVNPNK